MESVNEALRIQAEQASSYRLYLESVLQSMNGGIIVMDQKHAIQSWNCWSESIWGLRSEEVLGTSFEALDIGLPLHQLRDAVGGAGGPRGAGRPRAEGHGLPWPPHPVSRHRGRPGDRRRGARAARRSLTPVTRRRPGSL